jgi:LEA14-like dessication related protein
MRSVLLFGVVFVFSSCVSWKTPELISFGGIKDVKIKPHKLSLTVSGDVLNPNNKSIKLYESNVDLIIEDKKIGTISNLERITLIKNDRSSISVPLTIDTEKGALIRLAAFSLKDSVKVRFIGDLNVRAGVFKKKVPLDESMKISTRFLKFNKEDAIHEYR